MSKSKQNIEISMLEAGEHISVFFNNNQELIDTFNTICAHMLDLDGAFIIRTNGEIIGISKHGEFYRLYVSKKEDEYFIKYKNRKDSERLIPSNVETYFSYNKSCNEFFAENQDSLVAKERTRKERISRAYRILKRTIESVASTELKGVMPNNGGLGMEITTEWRKAHGSIESRTI